MAGFGVWIERQLKFASATILKLIWTTIIQVSHNTHVQRHIFEVTDNVVLEKPNRLKFSSSRVITASTAGCIVGSNNHLSKLCKTISERVNRTSIWLPYTDCDKNNYDLLLKENRQTCAKDVNTWFFWHHPTYRGPRDKSALSAIAPRADMTTLASIWWMISKKPCVNL